MNFDFSEDQKLIQSEARRFLREHCGTEKARAVLENYKLEFDQALWQQMAKQGWTGIVIDEQYGGSGLGYLELCLIAQEMGRALAPVPYASTVFLFTELIKLSSHPDQAEILSRVANGSLIGCVALNEQAGNTITAVPQSVLMDNSLTGKKIAVADGLAAHYSVVSSVDEDNTFSLALVDLEQAGVSRTTVDSIDPSRPVAAIQFDGAQGAGLAFEQGAQNALETVLVRAATLMAFEQVGGAEAALKMGIKYTKERFAFGRQVASFQAIKHKFADIYVANELALSNAYYAAWALSSGSSELALAAATARVSANHAYHLASKESLQAHGGMGYTWEFDCHLHYRRAQHLSLALGSTQYWNEQLAEALLAGDTINDNRSAA